MSKLPGARALWAILAVAASLSVSPVMAAPAAGASSAVASPIIVIVDMQEVQRESVAGKALAKQRESYQQSFQSEISSARQQLQSGEQELARQKGVLSQPAFEEKAKAFEGQVAAYQRRAQGIVRALDSSTAAAGNELSAAIIKVTSEVASEMGANLVLHKQQVFLHDERMDITKTVIERLNKSVTSVNFPAPVVEGEAVGAPAKAKGKK